MSKDPSAFPSSWSNPLRAQLLEPPHLQLSQPPSQASSFVPAAAASNVHDSRRPSLTTTDHHYEGRACHHDNGRPHHGHDHGQGCTTTRDEGRGRQQRGKQTTNNVDCRLSKWRRHAARYRIGLNERGGSPRRQAEMLDVTSLISCFNLASILATFSFHCPPCSSTSADWSLRLQNGQ